MLTSEAELAVQRIFYSCLRVTSGWHLFYLARALAFGSCIILFILYLVQIVSWKSGASVLGLVSWMPQVMNNYFAHNTIAAMSVVNVLQSVCNLSLNTWWTFTSYSQEVREFLHLPLKCNCSWDREQHCLRVCSCTTPGLTGQGCGIQLKQLEEFGQKM